MICVEEHMDGDGLGKTRDVRGLIAWNKGELLDT